MTHPRLTLVPKSRRLRIYLMLHRLLGGMRDGLLLWIFNPGHNEIIILNDEGYVPLSILALNHEVLHAILSELEGFKTSEAYDELERPIRLIVDTEFTHGLEALFNILTGIEVDEGY